MCRERHVTARPFTTCSWATTLMPVMSTPQISVVITTYKRPHLLPRAIASVLSQDVSNFEILVVDDEPSAAAAEAVAKFADPRIHYLAHKKNRGLSAARNTGINASSSPYITFLDDDDEFMPGRLRLHIEALDQTPSNIAVASCYEEIVNQNGATRIRAFDLNGSVLGALRRQDIVHAQMLTVRREVFDTVGLFDEALPHHEDLDMALRLAVAFKWITVTEPLLRMNQTAGSLSQSIPNRIIALTRIIETNPAIKGHRRWEARWLSRLARHHDEVGDPAMAKATLRQARRRWPFAIRPWLQRIRRQRI